MVSLSVVPFTPGDPEFRLAFLEATVPEALRSLPANRTPAWGRMTAQEMVEHLLWALRASLGRIPVLCEVPEERRNQMKPFIYDDRPNPRNFLLPTHRSGLPPAEFPDLDAALAAFRNELARFLAQYRDDPTVVNAHPVFGEITVEEWSRLHFKHFYHHLLQFSLLAEPGQVTP
jgi:oxepin-CoA hydrolase/3-oxo-5,6-dehydrosuberyl-CoA semialdehyde dehydrogenase